jgi:hypothetical protein
MYEVKFLGRSTLQAWQRVVPITAEAASSSLAGEETGTLGFAWRLPISCGGLLMMEKNATQ